MDGEARSFDCGVVVHVYRPRADQGGLD